MFIQTLPFPPQTDCTDASLTTPGWSIRDFTVDTDLELFWGTGTVGDVRFTVTNTANGYRFECHVGSSADNWVFDHRTVEGGRVWYSCNTDHYTPANALRTQVFFDMDSGEIGINQTWTCDDLGTA
jgi:hypothetical protein